MNGGTFDECGVCNGDGMSCDVVEGTFTELSTAGMTFRYCWFEKQNAQVLVDEFNLSSRFEKSDCPVTCWSIQHTVLV